jgi:hypothetical protein
MKICLVGAKLFHVDGRTDRQTEMRELLIAFHNFWNTSYMYFLYDFVFSLKMAFVTETCR